MALTDAQANAEILHGTVPATVILAGTVTRGDALGYSSGWKRALATTGSVIQARCVAAEDGVATQRIKVYFGDCILGGTRFSACVAGAAVYAAEGTGNLNGQYTETIPSTTGDAKTQIGESLDTTTILVFPYRNTQVVAT